MKEKPGDLRRHLPVASIVALLLCVFLWSALFARMADRNIGIDKDLLYLYVCGLEIKEPSRHDQQLELIRQLVSISASEHLIYRATMRAGYCNNFPFTSLSMYAVGELQRYFNIADPEKDFPKFISSSMWWGMTLSGAALGVLCLICVFWAARDALMLASLGAVTIAALLYVFVPPPNLSWMLHHSPPAKIVTLPDTLGLSLYSWLNPTGAFSPFSVFSRCLCAMLAFAAFTLRWSGRNGAAYWVPLIASFVHQSEAPILLAVMICCDLAIRPASLLRPACAVPIGLGVIVIALRESMFSIMGIFGLPIMRTPSFTTSIGSGGNCLPGSRGAPASGFAGGHQGVLAHGQRMAHAVGGKAFRSVLGNHRHRPVMAGGAAGLLCLSVGHVSPRGLFLVGSFRPGSSDFSSYP